MYICSVICWQVKLGGTQLSFYKKWFRSKLYHNYSQKWVVVSLLLSNPVCYMLFVVFLASVYMLWKWGRKWVTENICMCIILLCVDVCQFKLTHPTFKNLHPPTKLSYFFYPLPHLPVDVKNGWPLTKLNIKSLWEKWNRCYFDLSCMLTSGI